MSYYFAIVGTQDQPLFEYEFGTSKQGGDGQARFSDQARHLNPFILHSALDIAEEVQWSKDGAMYLKCIDKFFNSYISCFVTGSNVKFLLLHQPTTSAALSLSASTTLSGSTTLGGSAMMNTTSAAAAAAAGGSSRVSTSIGANPTSPQTEEAVRNFFADVFEHWVKAVMNPFYQQGAEVRSPVFRARVAASGRKYL